MLEIFNNRIDSIDEDSLLLLMESTIDKNKHPILLSQIDDSLIEAFMERTLEDVEKEKDIHLPSSLCKYKDISESIRDINDCIESEFLTSTITESEFMKLKDDFIFFLEQCMATEENVIAAMLPQPGEYGNQYKEEQDCDNKDDDEEDDECEDDAEYKETFESVLEYIQHPEYDYTIYTENSVIKLAKDIKSKLSSKAKISSKQMKNMIDKEILKSKIRIAKMKKVEPAKIAEMEKKLIALEKEARTLKKGVDPESLKELSKAAKDFERKIKEKESEGIENIDINIEEIKKNVAENVIIDPITSFNDIYLESYFGKSNTLKEAEAVLDQMLTLIKKEPNTSYTKHPLNQKLQKLFQKQFGFNNVFIIWNHFPASYGKMYTFVSSGIILKSRDNILVSEDGKRGFYDKNHSFNAYIDISIYGIQNTNVTASEAMGIILHEFGHNFDNSIYKKINIILQYVNTYQALLKNVFLLPEVIASLIPSTNSGKELMYRLANMKDNVREFLRKRIPKIDKVENAYYTFLDRMMNINEILFPVSIRGLYHLVGNAPFAMFKYLFAQHLTTVPTNKGELFADSFATSYGYGPDLAKGLEKISYLGLPANSSSEGKMNPFQRLFVDYLLFQRELINMIFIPTHGTNASRITHCKESLIHDLKNNEYPPEMKREILDSIADLQKIYNNNIESEKEGAKFILTSFVKKFTDRVFGGDSSLLAKVFPNFDAEVRLKQESTEISDYYYYLFTEKENVQLELERAEKENNFDLIHDCNNQLKYYDIKLEEVEQIIKEAANIDKEILPIIEKLNQKGYKTKYSSAGHTRLRKKEDKYRDGIYKGKLYSDARVMFDKDYNFPNAPKHWIWRSVDGKDYLDIDPKGYTMTKGDTPDESFSKWKNMYMSSLKRWVDNLPSYEQTKDKVEVKNKKGKTVSLETALDESMKEFETFFESSMNEIDNDLLEDGLDSVFIYN